MRILVCVKRVPAPGAKIVLTEDGLEIDAQMLSFAVSPHEECAVEEAVQLAEANSGSVTVLTVGPPEAEEQLRAAIAVGADTGVLIPTDGSDWDSISTANAIVGAIADLETSGDFDLILFGNESADAGGYQVGIRVAHALKRPVVCGVKGIDLAEDGFRLRRETAQGSEIYQLPKPAVVAVREGINLPRYPTLKGRLNSKKAEVISIPQDRLGSGQQMVRLISPTQEISETVLLAGVGDLVDLLEEWQLVRE